MEYLLSEICGKAKKLGLKIEISYGSGGYCILLKDRNNTEYYGYSWDANEAFETAENKFKIAEEFSEEDTAVDFRKNNSK